MKKLIYLFVILFIGTHQSFGTEQVPDILYYKGEKLTVDVGWGHPSPLETYFRQQNVAYPFSMLSTANYRGHIATWHIEDDKFYISEVSISDKIFSPQRFRIQSIDMSISSENKIFADWFSGILVCRKRKKSNSWNVVYSIYFHVKNGSIAQVEKITKRDVERIENISKKDTSDTELMAKYTILYLNQSYISYYFRLHDKEIITVDGEKGRISGKQGHSIILEYFDNDHSKWKYNWVNQQLSGAPNGSWEIEDNKLFLKEVYLHTGLEFDSPAKFKVQLSELFADKEIKNGKLFVDWATGIYVVVHGKEEKDEFGYKNFTTEHYTILRVHQGMIQEARTIASDFNFENPQGDVDEELKNLLEDYKQQKYKS